MLDAPERKELLKKANDAWIELERYVHEVMAPRFYKEKKGRRMELIAPWKNMAERITAEEQEQELYGKWLYAFQKYIAMTGERPHLPFLYTKQETPNGDRWIRRDPSQPEPH